MRKSPFMRALAILAVLVCVSALVWGQAVNFAQIQGRITDESGAAVSGATVKVTQIATGLVRTATSNAEGNYTFPSLPVGAYQMEVSASGFRNYVQKGITLQVNDTPTVNVAMKVGLVTEKVEVTADTAMVETHENSVSQVIDNSRIMEMPLNGRSAPDLIMLSGVATNNALNSNDLISSKNYGSGNAGVSGLSNVVSLAGSQQNATNFLLDGGDNNDAFSNVNAPFPFPDAIQEFSVQTSGLSARYGVHGGSVVSVVTKSGTNQYHGSGFEFLRNPYVNAQRWVAKPTTGTDTMKRNQFGGTFGGPVVKDKVMFFLGYQGTRQTATGSPANATLPTTAMLNGDFSKYLACSKNLVKGTAQTTPQGAATISTTGVANPAQFSPVALSLLKVLPRGDADPNGCGNVSFYFPSITQEDQGVAKIDWNVSSKQQVFARYFASDLRNPVDYDGANILSQATPSQFARWQSLVLSDTYTFNSGLVNSLHVVGTRLAINRGPATNVPTPTAFGINVPSPVENGLVVTGATGTNILGGSGMPGHFDNNAYQLSDDIDIMKGKHQLSFGVNYIKMQLNYLSTFQANGQFTFSTSNAFKDSMVNFLYGLPYQYTQGNFEWENWRYNYWGLYAHDNIKLRSNLTMNVGIRWEPYQPSTDTANRGSHFDYSAFMANQHSKVFPNAPAGLFYCGDAGVPCSFANKKVLDFSPRIGLVWDPKSDGKMTVRAGYGLFYDMPEMYYFDRYADNSPYGSAVLFNPNNGAGGGFANPYFGQTVPIFPTPFPTAGSSSAYFPTNGVYINNDYTVRPTYVQNWNLAIERQFGASWMLSATYMGSKTTHIWQAYEANPALPQNTVATTASGCTAGQAASTGNTNCRRALVIANPSQGQYFSNLTTLWDGADSSYNGLLLSAKKRLNNHFSLTSNYSWSHCISDADFTGELTNSRPTMIPSAINNPNPVALTADRGACGFDVRHNFASSVVMTSPKLNGSKGLLLNDWQFAPMVTFRSGVPFNVTVGSDTSLSGISRDRPNVTGNPYSGTCSNGYAVGDVKNCWFNTSVFTSPATGTFGNEPRNFLHGPSAVTFDAAVSRKFRIREGKELTLRLEAFNVLNHANFGNPASGMNTSSTFGTIQGVAAGNVGNPRQFQGALKFTF